MMSELVVTGDDAGVIFSCSDEFCVARRLRYHHHVHLVLTLKAKQWRTYSVRGLHICI